MPARFRKIVKAVKKRGGTTEAPNHGSHYKLFSATGEMYPIPAPNALKSEISDAYIAGLCRSHGYDYKKFVADL